MRSFFLRHQHRARLADDVRRGVLAFLSEPKAGCPGVEQVCWTAAAGQSVHRPIGAHIEAAQFCWEEVQSRILTRTSGEE